MKVIASITWFLMNHFWIDQRADIQKNEYIASYQSVTSKYNKIEIQTLHG